jgi:hypothetical protein
MERETLGLVFIIDDSAYGSGQDLKPTRFESCISAATLMTNLFLFQGEISLQVIPGSNVRQVSPTCETLEEAKQGNEEKKK